MDDPAQEGHVAGARGIQQLVGVVKNLQDTQQQPDREQGLFMLCNALDSQHLHDTTMPNNSVLCNRWV